MSSRNSLFFIFLCIPLVFVEMNIAEVVDDKEFLGKFEVEKVVGFDSVLDYDEVTGKAREERTKAVESQTIEISKKSADVWQFIRTEAGNTKTATFKLNEIFRETTPDKRECDSEVSKEGRKLLQHQECDPFFGGDIIWEFNGDKLVAHVSIPHSDYVVHYKRV